MALKKDIDVLDPSKTLREQINNKVSTKVTTPTATGTPAVTSGTAIASTPVTTPVVAAPVESEIAKQARQRYEAEQAYQGNIVAEGGVDLTRQTAEQRSQQLKDAMTTGGQTQTVTPVVEQKQTNITDLIKQQGAETTKALVAALKQRIAESTAAQQGIIAKAPQQFDPLRAQSEVSKSQQLRSALERSSNLGDRGGIGRQEAALTQTEGENRLNQINLAQQNVITDANAEIARLENAGKYEEAQIVASQAAQELQYLIAEQQRQEGFARQDEQIATGYSREDAQRAEALALDEKQRAEEKAAGVTAMAKEDFLNTLPGTRDFTQAILDNQKDGDTTNDWQIPYLELGKQDKLTGIAASEEKAIQDAADQAMSKWDKGIPLNAQDAAILDMRVGATKPKATSGSSGGASAATTISLAKWKVGQGLPLNAQEAAALGQTEGYVADTVKTDKVNSPSISTINKAISSAIGDPVTMEPSEIKGKTLNWIIENENLFLNDPELLRDTLIGNGVTVQELEAFEKMREEALGNTAFQ